MTTYTAPEMLDIWRRRLGLDISRPDCSVTAYEGIDLDAVIAATMRLWYLNILDTAPAAFVPTADFATRVSVKLDDSPDWLTVSLPDGARRPLSIRLKGWLADAPVVDADAAEHIIARMASPFGKPGIHTPLAVVTSQGIRATPATGMVDELIAVADPGSEKYVLDESLLSTIPSEPQLFTSPH